MRPGFGYNQQGRNFPDDNAYNRGNEMPKNFMPNQDNQQFYNFNNQFAEETNDSPQIPHHIKLLFDSDEKMAFDNRAPGMNPVNMQNRGSLRQTGPNQMPSNQMPPNQMLSNQMIPNQMNYANLMQLQNFNAMIGQTNDFGARNSAPKDLDTSNISRDSANHSLTNISRDSRTESRANLNTSKRNTSSRANVKDKNYQVTINEDINLIERIEIFLNLIAPNHNKICPFCSKIIDIKKCNFQNISAFMSNTTRKYYLTHFDCYLKSNSSHSTISLVPLTGIVEAKVNGQINTLTNIDTSNFLRSDRRAYFINIEGYHAISSYLLFRIDKLCYGLEHATYRNHLLYMNLSNTTTSIFEPNSYAIPFSEFRVVVTIHTSHSSEDPYIYEFLVDFSKIYVTADQKMKPVEVFYLHGENNIAIGTHVVFDANSELSSRLNYSTNLDSSFQSTGSASNPKPDFGKNLFIVLKYFTFSLPLKKVEKRIKEPTVVAQEEVAPPQNMSQQQKQAPQKKTHSKLQLNPNAPLFGAPGSNPVFEPNSQAYYPPGTNPNMNFQQNKPQAFKPAGNPPQPTNFGSYPFNPMGGNMDSSMGSHQQANTGGNPNANMYFNAPPFGQNFQMEQNMPVGHFNKMQGMQNQGMQNQGYNFPPNLPPNSHTPPPNMPPNLQGGGFVKPPGLGAPGDTPIQPFLRPPSGSSGFPNANVNFNESPGKKKPLQVDTKGLNPPGIFPSNQVTMEELASKLENAELPITPDRLPQEGFDGGNLDRGRGKNFASNLYTAVLSGKRRESSTSKSPSLAKIQNKYFSGFSTPRSENTFTPPQANTPLRTGSHNEIPGVGDIDDQQWTEDMIENFKLENYIDNLVEFAKTYNGSRVLQKFFPRANQNEIDAVINKIQDKIDELMLDPYANYMFQTLAQSCSSEQRYHLLQKIAPSMVKIACDRKGTHSLQAIVSLISRDVEDKLIRDTLDGHVLELTLDPQGTHLIQKLIVAISLNNITFIYQPVIARFIDVANNSFGLCVLKQLMTKAEKSENMRDTIIGLLYQNLEELIQNPYGNYAVQHALDSYPKNCDKILDKILDKIIQYSNQKFSSNVIEKCLILATPEYKKRFVRELIKSDRVTELMKNKYGNFVILKVLATADAEDKGAMMQSLLKNVNAVNVTKYKNRWIQFIEENPMKIPGFPNNQTVKPSQFKQGPNNSNPSFEDNLSAASDDAPWHSDDWGNEPKQQDQKKRGSKFSTKEEKSQFFYKSNKPPGGNMPDDYEGEAFGFGPGPGQYPEQGGYASSPGYNQSPGLRGPGDRGQNPNMGGYPGKQQQQQQYKGGQNQGNQKFYSDKQNNSNKWGGYNNFY